MEGGSLVKALVISYEQSNHTATVQPQGSSRAYLSGIVVAANIAAAEVLAGRRAVVVQFDRYRPGEGVLIALY